MLKVLFVVSECVPFIKTGGLADVAGSFPPALKDRNVDVRIVLPLYKGIRENLGSSLRHIGHTMIDVGWRRQYCGVEETDYRGVPVYFIDNEYYFKREGLYGYDDEAERFAFFNRAVLEIFPHIGFYPQIIHCNDWHTGLIPVYLHSEYGKSELYKDIKTIFTIHNLQHQGVFPPSILGDILNFDSSYFTSDFLEFYGNVNYMKGALMYTDIITTVSPAYAEEIKTELYGEKLDGVLVKRGVRGILNGLDYRVFDPENDSSIFVPYSAGNMQGKRENKRRLQEKLGLYMNENVPVIGIVSRLASQKGLDLIACVIHEIMALGIELVVLGKGENRYEDLFRSIQSQYPGRAYAYIGYEPALAQQIYAGSDMFLMPSLFEPCGLGQLISMRYGSIPIVRETGGLKDTVMPYNEFTGEGNGFSFTNYNAHDMLYTIGRAVNLYKDGDVWSSIVSKAMECNYSWDASAAKYIGVYESMADKVLHTP